MQLSISTETQGTAFCIKPVGEIDAHTAPSLAASLTTAVEEGFTTIVLDLSEVPFIDSTGIGVMVDSLRRVKEAGGSIILAAVHDNVQRVIFLLGLDEQFTIVDDMKSALELC